MTTIPDFTPCEMEILQLILTGYINKELGESLGSQRARFP